MATESSILAWEIPRTEETGRLRSMGLQKSWTLLSASMDCYPVLCIISKNQWNNSIHNCHLTGVYLWTVHEFRCLGTSQSWIPTMPCETGKKYCPGFTDVETGRQLEAIFPETWRCSLAGLGFEHSPHSPVRELLVWSCQEENWESVKKAADSALCSEACQKEASNPEAPPKPSIFPLSQNVR